MSIGKMELLSSQLYKLSNWKHRVVLSLCHSQEHKILKNNSTFKKSQAGKRCFIIGNGPSIKKQDLALLKDEFVFTVNRMVNMSNFGDIRSNIHIWSDMDFFSEELFESGVMLQLLNATNTQDNKPTCFFPLQAKPILEKYNFQNVLDVNYFKQGQNLYVGYQKDIDLTNLIISGSTVVLVAIAIAAYMGFEEINLLGCDCTSAKGYIDAFTSKSLSEYGVDSSSEEQSKLLAQNTILKHSAEYSFRNFYMIFRDYRIISDFCKKRGIQVYNCTEGGILDVFPLRTLKEALIK